MKRFIDITFSLVALIFLILPMVIVSCLVLIFLGRPIFFKQVRPGFKGRPFTLLKFRTMTFTCDESGALLPDQLRVTPFGLLLRRTSLDEIPEFWNVLCGHMSLVGPRPLLQEYMKIYTPFQLRRHDVRPGITGLSQIHGRNRLSFEAKIRLDIWYVDHHNMALDLWIMMVTIWKVLRRDGIDAVGPVSRSTTPCSFE